MIKLFVATFLITLLILCIAYIVAAIMDMKAEKKRKKRRIRARVLEICEEKGYSVLEALSNGVYKEAIRQATDECLNLEKKNKNKRK